MMRAIVRTNDPVLISFLGALFRDAGIACHVADVHMSVVEGSIGVFPRRICVGDDDIARAVRLLRDAGLQSELVEELRDTSPGARGR
jgi:hypothetical protein